MNFDDLEFDNDSAIDGNGLQLLMNTKTRSKTDDNYSSINNIKRLEDNLNNMSMDDENGFMEEKYNPQSSLFDTNELDTMNLSSSSPSYDNTNHINFVEKPVYLNENKTWDNFAQYDNIPQTIPTNDHLPMSQNKEMETKMDLIYKMKMLKEKKKITFLKEYTVADSLQDIQADYNAHKKALKTSNWVNAQKKLIVKIAHGLEFINGFIDPFDLKLDGFAEKLEEDMSLDPSYDDVFESLAEKYSNSAEMYPEIKLLFLLGGSAALYGLEKSSQKASNLFGVGDAASSALKQYQDANRIAEQSLMNAMLNQNDMTYQNFDTNAFIRQQQNLPMQPSQPPSQLRQPSYQAPKFNQTDFTNPDITRGGNNTAAQKFAFKTPLSALPNPELQEKMLQRPNMNQRREMSGPKDISKILEGIKTQNVEISDSESVITLDNLKKTDMSSINLPKKRRNKSEKSDIFKL